MAKIEQLSGLEILDSRGQPTIQVTCRLAGGASGSAQVPAGASTGRAEAIELRDGDPRRYRGLGCRKAVEKVNGEVAARLTSLSFENQRQLDHALLRLDGTANKSRLGANSILGVSLAFARATAVEERVPLYEHFASMVPTAVLGGAPSLPRLTVNLFSGGKHAGGQLALQDVLIVPAAACTVDQALASVCAVYQAAAEIVREAYAMRLLTADEGGLAPPFAKVEAAFTDTLAAIERAGMRPGEDIKLAVDVAASHFCAEGAYWLDGIPITGDAMIQEIDAWVATYPIVSVEDGLAEEDWQHWPALRARLAPRALTVGDDLLCTNPNRIRRAADAGACDTLLLKVNQIGTLSEAADALQLARSASWNVTVSARSGETEDDWLADLAVGWRADQIKIGSVTQSERLAKYNRLLAIEAATGWPTVHWPSRCDR